MNNKPPAIRTRGAMRSRQVRSQVGNNGVRKIDKSDLYEVKEDSGFLSRILDWGRAFKNWFASKLQAFTQNINFQSLMQGAVALFQGVWNFNWDISDQAIERNILSLQGQLIDRTSGLLGNLAGKAVCGGLPILGMAFLNKAAAVHVARSAGVEILTDLAFAFGSYIRGVLQNAGKQLLWTGYKNVRTLLKKVILGDKYVGKAILALIPGGEATVKAWGDNKQEDWSFQGLFQEKVLAKLPEEYDGSLSSIINQSSVEEFIDEFSDACEDSLIAVAQGIDSFIGLQKLQYERDGQLIRTTIKPYGEQGEEINIFTSVRDQAAGIAQAMNSVKMLDQRDIGSFVGTPWDEVQVTEGIGYQLTLIFFNFESPPYYSKERRGKLAKTEIKLPNVKKSMIDWNRIKNDFGKTSPFRKGSIKGEINLSNGRHVAFYADSDNDIEQMAEKLEKYLEPDIVYPIKFSEMKGRGKSKSAKYIKSQKMYLAHLYIVNWERINKYIEYQQDGFSGIYEDPRKKSIKIEMYPEVKPSWIDEKIREAIKNSLQVADTTL